MTLQTALRHATRGGAVLGAATALAWPAPAFASDMCVLVLWYTLPAIWLSTPLAWVTGLARTTTWARLGLGLDLALCVLVGVICLYTLPVIGCSGDGPQVLAWTFGSASVFAVASTWSFRRLLRIVRPSEH